MWVTVLVLLGRSVWREAWGGRPLTIGAILFFLGLATPSHAVIYYSTADVNYNTTAPTGALAGSGWQWVGEWIGFQGTAIGPNHFLTAKHVGGSVGNPFVYRGVSYTTTAVINDSVSDLSIWQVAGTMPDWAPLYRGSDEVGKSLVVFGRGLTRGSEVRVNGILKGWMWGSGDGRLRWGENTVRTLIYSGPTLGDLLYATLDAGAGPNEAHLAVGDSSGPIFINDGSGWKLAGVAYSVDAYFSYSGGSDPGFIAALFDCRALYFGSAGGWNLIQSALPVPTGFYASRVSARVNWIDSIVPPASPVTVVHRVDALPPLASLLAAFALAGIGFAALRKSGSPKPRRPRIVPSR